MEWCRMKEKYQGRSKKDLADMARRKGISGWRAMEKNELIVALVAKDRKTVKSPVKAAVKKKKPQPVGARSRSRTRPQRTAAHSTRNGTLSAEEQVERSKYDVGVPTKDLSAKVPRDLPGG